MAVCPLCEAAASDGHHELAAEVLDLRARQMAMETDLHAIRNHWNEFGESDGFAELMERACAPIDINKGVGSTWAGLPRSPASGLGRESERAAGEPRSSPAQKCD